MGDTVLSRRCGGRGALTPASQRAVVSPSDFVNFKLLVIFGKKSVKVEVLAAQSCPSPCNPHGL